MDYKSILDDLEKEEDEQRARARAYENIESWAMAYLSIWVVLENAIKKVYGVSVRQELLPQIIKWKDYLEGSGSKAPKKITNFSVEPFTIPPQKQIEKALGKCPLLQETLDPKNRWRKKRNAIAHSAEEFGRKNTYAQYKGQLDKALGELKRVLSGK